VLVEAEEEVMSVADAKAVQKAAKETAKLLGKDSAVAKSLADKATQAAVMKAEAARKAKEASDQASTEAASAAAEAASLGQLAKAALAAAEGAEQALKLSALGVRISVAHEAAEKEEARIAKEQAKEVKPGAEKNPARQRKQEKAKKEATPKKSEPETPIPTSNSTTTVFGFEMDLAKLAAADAAFVAGKEETKEGVLEDDKEASGSITNGTAAFGFDWSQMASADAAYATKKEAGITYALGEMGRPPPQSKLN
jgi:hypothetical protein